MQQVVALRLHSSAFWARACASRTGSTPHCYCLRNCGGTAHRVLGWFSRDRMPRGSMRADYRIWLNSMRSPSGPRIKKYLQPLFQNGRNTGASSTMVKASLLSVAKVSSMLSTSNAM